MVKRFCLLFALLMASHIDAGHARDRLTIGITQYPSGFHPSIDSMLVKTYILGMTQRPITTYDQDWSLICMLCETLPTFENGLAEKIVLDDGTEGARVTYKLREDFVWGDGQPMTVDDVLFTWEVGKHPRSGIVNGEMYRDIIDIEVHSQSEFTLIHNKLDFQYNAINDFRLIPAHLERPVFEAAPDNYRLTTLYNTAPDTPGLWFGPYRISRTVAGQRVELEKNKLWQGPEASFERITVRSIENTPALEANILAGEIDMIAGEAGLPIDQALDLERREGDRFNIFYKPGLIYEHLDVRLDHPSLSDARVRQAITHAIDREAISSQLFENKQPVAHSSVSPLDAVYDDELPKYNMNLDEAAKLLDEAGFDIISNDVRTHADGRKLEIDLLTTAGNTTRESVAQIIQAMLGQVGIKVSIVTQPARVMFGESMNKRQFEGLAMFAWISAPENVPRTTLHSTMIPTAGNGWSGQNYTGYIDDDMDALLDRIEITLDFEERKALWSDLQHQYATDLPAIPLYFRADSHIWPTWLSGVRPTGHSAPSTLWVEEWVAAD